MRLKVRNPDTNTRIEVGGGVVWLCIPRCLVLVLPLDLDAGPYLQYDSGDDKELRDMPNDITPVFSTERTFLQHDLGEENS